jgi:hypothetical protein
MHDYSILRAKPDRLLDTYERHKVLAALAVIDPNSYEKWVTVCACLVALRGNLGDESLANLVKGPRRVANSETTNPEQAP